MPDPSHHLLAAWSSVSTVWLITWAVLAAATIGIVILLRTRWRDARPWTKCAVLSLWVHVLLGCVAAVVRITSGPGIGSGIGPGAGIAGEPIRVAIVTNVAAPSATDAGALEADPPMPPDEEASLPAIEAPPLVELPEPMSPDPAADLASTMAPILPAPTVLSFGAPPLISQPAPPAPPSAEIEAPNLSELTISAESTFDSPRELATLATNPIITSNDVRAEGIPAAQTVGDPPPSQESALAEASVSSLQASRGAASAPTAYAARFAPNRGDVVASGGGNANTEMAVQAALAWLAAAQEQDGRWNSKRFGAGQERYVAGQGYVLGQYRGGAGAKADAGVGALALLALMGAGNTDVDGDHAASVVSGLDYLCHVQTVDGNLAGDAEPFARMYCHSMATFALCEAYALTKNERWAAAARAGVGYSLAAQHPADGGWRYQPGQQGDTSQLGWQLMALKSAHAGGIDVPATTWTKAERFLRTVERGQFGGLAAYRSVGPPSRSMTAEALYSRQLLTGRADGGLSLAALDEALDSLLREPPTADGVNLYYWYYATLALHHAQNASPASAHAWRRWNHSLTTTLLSIQNPDGSWPDTCLWGGYGGRIFTTSLAAMCLEVYYRYAPPEAADVAQRDQWNAPPQR